MIPGTFIGSQAQSGPIGIYRADYGTNNNAGNFTFTNADLGNPSSDRVIAVVLNYWEFDTTVSVNSLVIGGVSMTNRITAAIEISGASGSYLYASIWSASIPSGATGTISVNFDRSIERGCQVGVWSLYNLASAIPFSATGGIRGGLTAGTLTANVQPNDFGIVGASAAYGTGTAAVSYANATERYDTRSTGAGVQDIARSGADFQATAVQTPRTVTITPSGISDGSAFVMAVWR
jgi:hypothetical protein